MTLRGVFEGCMRARKQLDQWYRRLLTFGKMTVRIEKTHLPCEERGAS
jgi:hypothetical protein